MSHPYLARRAQITGFFAVLLVFGTVCAVVLRSPIFAISGAAAAAVLLALAVYYQIRFGPHISEVTKTAPWPPNSFQGWFGLFMFIVAVIGMVVIVLWHVLHGYRI